MSESTDYVSTTIRDRFRAFFGERTSVERTVALKERIYASLTGLAIVAALALSGHQKSDGAALVSLIAGIVGIVGAAFVAEVIAHLVNFGAPPSARKLWVMTQISIGAITSASLPVLVLAGAALDLYDSLPAIYVSIALYFVSLIAVVLVAARRTSLGWRQQLLSAGVLLGSGLIVIVVLILAH